MAKGNQFERMAEKAARRIDRARAAGEQLGLFERLDAAADDAALPDVTDAARGRGKGKALSTLREIMARRGYQMPEDVLAHIAALDDAESAEMAALKKATMVAAAIYGDADPPPGAVLRLFETFYASGLRALDALLPYGLGKVTPDAAPVQAVQVVVAGAPPVDRGAQARDVTPRPGQVGQGPMPADLRWQIEQNQRVSQAANGPKFGRDDSEGASD